MVNKKSGMVNTKSGMVNKKLFLLFVCTKIGPIFHYLQVWDRFIVNNKKSDRFSYIQKNNTI